MNIADLKQSFKDERGVDWRDNSQQIRGSYVLYLEHKLLDLINEKERGITITNVGKPSYVLPSYLSHEQLAEAVVKDWVNHEQKVIEKTYEVTLLLIIDAFRDRDLKTPETKRVEYLVRANSEQEAIKKGRELNQSNLGIWESWANEM